MSLNTQYIRASCRRLSSGVTEEAIATMAFTGLISAIVLAIFAILKVEGTARGAVPLDTLTFDKVFLKMVVPVPWYRFRTCYSMELRSYEIRHAQMTQLIRFANLCLQICNIKIKLHHINEEKNHSFTVVHVYCSLATCWAPVTL